MWHITFESVNEVDGAVSGFLQFGMDLRIRKTSLLYIDNSFNLVWHYLE